MSHRRRGANSVRTAKELQQLDGDKGMLAVVTRFYAKLLADPVTGVLFDDHDEPHAWRLAAFFTRHYGGVDVYSEERGRGFHALFVNHHKGMMCPKRGDDAGTRFTTSHKALWLQYMAEACDEIGVSAGFKRHHMAFCNSAMHFYGPFWDDTEQVAKLRAKLAREGKAGGCPHAVAAAEEGAPKAGADSDQGGKERSEGDSDAEGKREET